MKKKYLVMMVAVLAVAGAIIGGSLAAFNASTEGSGLGEAGISVKEVGVSFNEVAPSQAEVTTKPGGDWVNPQPKIINNTDEGYDIYVKVIVNKYWGDVVTDNEGNLSVVYSEDLNDADYESATDKSIYTTAYVGESKRELLANSSEALNDWIITEVDSEQIVMYYTKPIAPGEASSDYLTGISFSELIGNSFADSGYGVDVEVTAVQANSAYDAIAAELGVYMTFDDNGVITSVSESR